MSEEIKEKIDKSKENHRYNITSSREWFENLLDYITNLQQENKQLKDKNNHIEQWWKETNVIIRNEKSLAINDNAMEYILSLEHKIGKAIDWCNEIIRTFCEDDKQVVVAYEIKEILGDKE